MGKKARMMARQETSETQRVRLNPIQDVTSRCKVTHDVPYTLRCVLHEDHVHVVVRSAIVTSGEHAGATVTVYQPHEDKNGRTW